ncbi:MAG TPA: PilN domain-containing protein [Candidatus Eisenbacteria bacterium]|nr:PilN domain-containing protein [Candidatus Eisenbacteria bacterium]
MIRINLLPRDERKTRRAMQMPKIGSLMPVLVLLLVIALFGAVSVFQALQIGRLHADIARTEQEAAKLKPQIQTIQELTLKREELQRRLTVIADLDKTRLQRVMLVDELSRCVPEHLWLTSYEETANKVQIEGVTFSNLLVADFMTRLEASPLYGTVDLLVAEKGTIDQRNVVKFKVTALMTL